MDKNATPARIPCNEKVKKYTIATLKRLGIHCTLAKLYETLMAGKSVKTRHNAAALSLLQELTEKIDGFIPPVPTSNSDVKKIKQFLAKWKEKVTHLNEDMNTSTASPVYLRDQVNVLLQQKKCNVQCSNNHLEWFLLRYGAEAMTPDKIASAIIQHSETDWNNLKTPIKDDEYHPRLVENTKESRQSFREKVEFIYDFVYSFDVDALAKKLQNDLDVISDMQKWQKETPRSYEYAERYQSLLDRLQTAPKFKLRKNPALSAATVDAQKECEEPANDKVRDDMVSDVNKPEEAMMPNVQTTNQEASQESAAPEVIDNEPTDEELENLPTDDWWQQNYQTVINWLEESNPDDYGKTIIENGNDNLIAFSKLPDFYTQYNDIKRSFEYSKPQWPIKWIMSSIEKKLKQREKSTT